MLRTQNTSCLEPVIEDRGAPEHGRFLALDALRGFAAVSVALLHYNYEIIPRAYLAVDLFFALSGFVLVSTYAPRFSAGLSTWRFIRMRIVRLYP